jgi:hypothetical protein
MSYNYERQFHGQEKLAQQPLSAVGDLTCQYTGSIFSQVIVDAYNRYTIDFNKSTWRAEQEFLLDQRHRFIHGLMYENLNQTQT